MTIPRDPRRPAAGLDEWYAANVPGSDWDDATDAAPPDAAHRRDGCLCWALVAALLLLWWLL